MRREVKLNKVLAVFFSVTLVAGLWPAPATPARAEANAEQAGVASDEGAPQDSAPASDAAGAQADPATPAEADPAAPSDATPDGDAASSSGSAEAPAEGQDAEKSDAADATPGQDATDAAQQGTTPAAAPSEDGQGSDAVAKPADATPAADDKAAPDEKADDKADDTKGYPALDARLHAGNGVTVVVSAPEGAFPEGTQASVGAADAARVMAAAAQMTGGQTLAAVAVDITFTHDGKVVEPRGGRAVTVRLLLSESLDGPSDYEGIDALDFFGQEAAAADTGEQYVVVHIPAAGAPERVSATTATDLGAEFEATSFSTYGLAAVGPNDEPGVQLSTQATYDIAVDSTVHKVSREGASVWNSSAAGTQFTVGTSDDYGLWRFVVRGGRGGGSAAAGGGYGGVTTVVQPYGEENTFYVVTGGQGVTGRRGGSNGATTGAANGGGGGGNGRWRGGGPGNCSAGGSGGGATHIALSQGALKDVGAGDIMLVAGGGGGAGWNRGGGSGGGVNGGNGGAYSGSVPGGTQTTGYQMGQGQDGIGGTYNVQRGSEGKGGGGGGYWGGTARTYGGRNSNAAGAGGSGFLNGSFVHGTKSSGGDTVALDGITIARTANGGNSGAGTASVEYLASIVKLDKQDATEQGTENVYAAPKAPDYYLSYSVDGLANKSDKIQIPTRTGYIFEGYYTEKGFDIWTDRHDGTQYIAADGTISPELYEQGSLTLYAHMVPIWAMVTLNPGETSDPGTPAVYERYEQGIYNEKSSSPTQIFTINIPERNCDITYDAKSGSTTRASEKISQTFLGYYDGDTQLIDGNGVILEAFAFNRFLANVTLEAQWQSASTTLPNATRDGFTFDGWYDKADGTRVGGANDKYTPAKPAANLEAHWTPIVYTVTLDGKGATGPEGRTTQVFEKYNTGVYVDAECTTKADTIVPPERTYRVTYDLTNGGTMPAGHPATYDDVSYTFDGYYTPQGGSTKMFDAVGQRQTAFTNTFFLENRTLNAHWTEGTVDLPTPTAPTGNEFLGWSTSKDARSGRTGSFTPTENVTLYAVYAPNKYTIAYAGLDDVVGFNPPDTIGFNESEEAWQESFNVPNPKKSGYAFTGWDISEMHDGVTHYIGSTDATTTENTASGILGTYFKNLRASEGQVKFEAQWKSIALPVKLNEQGATSSGSKAVYEAYGQNIWKTKTEVPGVDPTYSDEMDPNGDPSGNAAIDLPQKVYQLTYDLGSGKTGTLTDLTQDATYAFGGYFTDTNGTGQQLLGPDGKVTSSFTNKYFSADAEDATLYAAWSGGTVQLRNNESKTEGYRFIGWSETEGAEVPTYLPGDTIKLTGAKTLHAVYDQPTYVVSYSAHGGSGAPDPQSKRHNATLVLSADKPTREVSQSNGATVTFNANQGSSTGAAGDAITGIVDSTWDFTSWNTLPEGGGKDYNASGDYTANEAVTLHAQWRETPTRRSIVLPTPYYEGHICQGWSTDAEGTDIVGMPGGDYTPTSDRTLYAQWTPARYKIAYYDGDTLVRTSPEYSYGEQLTVETAESLGISRTGWKLEGWSLEDGSLTVDYMAGVRAQNLANHDDTVRAHAIWSRVLTFVSGEGDPVDEATDAVSTQSESLRPQSLAEVEVHQFTDGHTIGKIETPEIEPIEGFTSLGWVAQAEDVSGKVDLAAETESEWTSEDTTFFGVYSRDASITYDGAGATDGITEMSVGQQYYNASGAIGKASALLAQNGFERRGYSFATWSLGKPGETYEWEAKLEEPATKTAEAVWLDLKQYLVTFDANGGEGEMAPQVMDLGVKTALTENAFRRAGFTFAGWNTAADGSGKAFADREGVLDLAKTGEEVTLFAQWSPVRAAPSPATNDPTPQVLIGILLVVAAVAIVVGVRSRRSRKG